MGSQKKRSILPLVFAGTVTALMLSACSSLDPDNVSNDDRTLVWTTGTNLGSLDVVADQVNGTARRLLLGSVVEGLTRVSKTDDGLEWKPLLATHWERVKPTVWRFDLRKGAYFIQPDLQYITRPGGMDHFKSALVVGAQFGINF